jgi:hypothetical protein
MTDMWRSITVVLVLYAARPAAAEPPRDGIVRALPGLGYGWVLDPAEGAQMDPARGIRTTVGLGYDVRRGRLGAGGRVHERLRGLELGGDAQQ